MSTIDGGDFAEWTALVHRERMMAYHMSPVKAKRALPGTSPASAAVDLMAEDAGNMSLPCPSAWREKIVEWCFQVVDHCDMDRDLVFIAMSFFDRYLSRYSVDETLTQLVAMTCLYLAVKVHSSKKISISSIVSLSRGFFRLDQVVKMEMCIMKSLNWYLNPPTPSTFVDILHPMMLELTEDEDSMAEIKDLAKYLLELSVCDGYFINKNPSLIAHAAITAAMNVLATPIKIQRRLQALPTSASPPSIDECAGRLHNIYSVSMSEHQLSSAVTGREASPTSVFS